MKFNLLKDVIFIFTILLFSNAIVAQNRMGFSFLWGEMKPHSSYIEPLRADVRGIQLSADWDKEVISDKLFSVNSKNTYLPNFGATALYLDMGHPQTGNQLALGATVGGKFTFGKSFHLGWKYAQGFSYLSKKYDSSIIPINYGIGSHVNYFAQVSTYALLDLNDFATFNFGYNLNHCSNGNWKKPNVGLNVLNFNAGLNYRISDKKRYRTHRKYSAFPWYAGAKLAIRDKSIEYPHKSFVWILDLGYRIQNSSSGYWDYGLDWFYDPNYYWNDLGDLIETRESQIQELGIRAGRVFLWGRLGLRLDAGIYAIQPMHTEKPWFYNAIGWEYRIRDNWLLRNRLKAHLNKADYMEWGIQYLW